MNTILSTDLSLHGSFLLEYRLTYGANDADDDTVKDVKIQQRIWGTASEGGPVQGHTAVHLWTGFSSC